MPLYRNILTVACAGMICWTAGCVSPLEYNTMARQNLQLQDKLTTSQAERAKARTQAAMLRQEVLEARQARQEVQNRVDNMGREIELLNARIDLQAETADRARKDAPQTQPSVSLSRETLDKLVGRIKTLTDENSRLRDENTKIQYQLKQQQLAR